MLKVKAVSIRFHRNKREIMLIIYGMKTMQYFKHDIRSHTFFTSLLMLIVQFVMMAPLKKIILDIYLDITVWRL